MLNMAKQSVIKCKALSMSEKLKIIKKVDVQPYDTKDSWQIAILVLMLKSIMANNKKLFQQCVIAQPARYTEVKNS